MGAGPAVGLECLECPDFDPAYACKMYAQNSVIIAVTEYGAKRATDGNLRAISREINAYLTSANGKLQTWRGAMTCDQCTGDCDRAQAIIAQLSENCTCFDGIYAKTLSELLHQSDCADTLGGTKAVTPQLRQQAQFLTGKDADWTMRLDRWVGDHSESAA
jgi:hypothetical protein